jgi:hypothetical protein
VLAVGAVVLAVARGREARGSRRARAEVEPAPAAPSADHTGGT